MRNHSSIGLFVASLIVTTIASAWCWEAFINNKLYNCTDSVPLDYLQPGQWVHQPIPVPQIVIGSSMSEPDTIKLGWSVLGLWLLWLSFVFASFVVSFLIARLPRIASKPPQRMHDHTNAA
jgi:hypothetical protein